MAKGFRLWSVWFGVDWNWVYYQLIGDGEEWFDGFYGLIRGSEGKSFQAGAVNISLPLCIHPNMSWYVDSDAGLISGKA